MEYKLFLIIIFGFIEFALSLYFVSENSCPIDVKENQKFSLLKNCKRSQKRIIAVENFESLYGCEQFALQNNGLAFNYSPRVNIGMNLYNQFDKNGNLKNVTLFQRNQNHKSLLDQPEEFFNCLIFDCPETLNFTNVVKDSRFDYYSLYSNPPPPTNSTCVPLIGVFLLYSKQLNYSEAFKTCKLKANGSLAHVISDKRTNALSNLLANFKESEPNLLNSFFIKSNKKNLKYAYVGLNFTRKLTNQFLTPNNKTLNCFLFRAWAPGHPIYRRRLNCVAITQENSWVTIDCKRKLPFICEIYSSKNFISKKNYKCIF